MSSYRQGRGLEWKVRDHLAANGYRVMRAAGSKGCFDLLAVKPQQLLMIQVKRTAPPGPHAWNLLLETAQWANAVPLLATCPPRRPIRLERLTGPKVPGQPVATHRLLAPFPIDFADKDESHADRRDT